MKPRTIEGEKRRVAALRSPEIRQKMSDAHKGHRPKNFEVMRKLGWIASRKEILTYSGIHAWVKRSWGRANKCELCGKRGLSGSSVHWANKDHKYSRDRCDWMMVCRPCHAQWDMKYNGTNFTKKSLRGKEAC